MTLLRVLSSFLSVLFFQFVPRSTLDSSTWLDKVYLQRLPTIFCQLWNNSTKSTKGVKSTSYIHLEHLNRHFWTKWIITNWAWRICPELNWVKFWNVTKIWFWHWIVEKLNLCQFRSIGMQACWLGCHRFGRSKIKSTFDGSDTSVASKEPFFVTLLSHHCQSCNMTRLTGATFVTIL